MGGTRIATGIYQDAHGITIRVRGKDTRPRWPLGTPTLDLIKERKALLDSAGPCLPRTGTFAEDVEKYLATIPADVKTGIERRRRHSDAKRLLTHWRDAETTFDGRPVTFGQLPRAAITALMIRAQIARWRSGNPTAKPLVKPLSEATCDKHRSELVTLYNTLNGKEGYNPARAVPKFNPTYDDPRGFDLAVLDRIIESMPDRGKPPKGSRKKDGTIPTVNTAKLRLRVMRHCAIPPQTLKRVRPGDINLPSRMLTVRPRRKGAGAKGRTLPLTTGAVDALRALVTHDLLGWFDQRAVNRAFKRAAANYRRAWKHDHPNDACPVPDDLHAYDLRHAFLSEVYRRRRDKKIVTHLAGQAENSRSSDRYIQAAVDEVARAAVDALEPTSTSVPPEREKKGKSSTKLRKQRKPRAA